MQGKIIYQKGDATDPIFLYDNEVRIIIHICNNTNKWGKGFVMALSSRWPTIDQIYHKYPQILGTIQPLIKISEDLFVCNMIAQEGIKSVNSVPPIRYDALKSCLYSLAEIFKSFNKISIHMPRIGCGLAGGKWSQIKEIINDILITNGFNVVVYDLV